MSRSFRLTARLALGFVIAIAAGNDSIAESPPAPDSPKLAETRAWLRSKVTTNKDRQRYGIRLDDAGHGSHAAGPTVLLLHGLNSRPTSCRALLGEVRAAGLPCGNFAYPNDQPLRQSAELLANELRQLAAKHPHRRFALVTHSMGGLVARGCVEDPSLQPNNVDRLVMVAPPTHGSALAHYGFATDLWEHWYVRKQGSPWRRARDAIVDGLGEAVADLCPNSAFLHELNTRPRNANIKYTVILGTAGPISRERMAWLHEHSQKRTEGYSAIKPLASKTASVLRKMPEFVEGQGDGVVAIRRGKLAGVEDVVLLPFDHLSVVEPSEDAAVQQVRRIILDRIQEGS